MPINIGHWTSEFETRRPASTGIFSQEYKYFDQHFPTVKNETTV